MNDIDLEEIRSWMGQSGSIARRYFKQSTGRRKADRTWVTEADIEIERTLVSAISARYPEHGILGEEQTWQAPACEFLWALDPIDGTASFVAGLPNWCISIGLLREQRPYVGMIYLPLLEDCYWADTAGNAFLNDRPIHVATPHSWDSEDWIAIPSNTHRRFAIDFSGKTRTLGSVAASFCYVARGTALGTLVAKASLWDIAAGLAILYAAGGEVSGLSGNQVDTSIMINRQVLTEPIIASEPSQMQALRAAIHQR